MAADSPTRNRRCVLTQWPQGGPVATCFEMQEKQLSPLGRGEARVRVEWLSIDPTQRGWLNPGPNYRAPGALDGLFTGANLGKQLVRV